MAYYGNNGLISEPGYLATAHCYQKLECQGTYWWCWGNGTRAPVPLVLCLSHPIDLYFVKPVRHTLVYSSVENHNPFSGGCILSALFDLTVGSINFVKLLCWCSEYSYFKLHFIGPRFVHLGVLPLHDLLMPHRMSLQQRSVVWDWVQGMPQRSRLFGKGISLRVHTGRGNWLSATLFDGSERCRLWAVRAEMPLAKPSAALFSIERTWQVATTPNLRR